ncbi:S-layer homology domain-containing protein [Inediibacterium massiliense]|uniref:NHL domain-containing protein n=1 Tax=Inediibacterium massiliense TaxID=1658111 RepID=UPI0006B58A9D|nr:S-layer homology domain-containing protein [Inediibacterium massiliense]
MKNAKKVLVKDILGIMVAVCLVITSVGILLIDVVYASDSDTVTVVAGNGTAGFSGDGGPAVSAQLNYVRDIAIDSDGNIYIAESANRRIRKIDTLGNISTFAGDGTLNWKNNVPATSSGMYMPYGVDVDSNGNVYIVNSGFNEVRKVDTKGIITTVAGDGSGYFGDGGPATLAKMSLPSGVAVDSSGNIYIADTKNHCIRKIDAITGIINTIAGNGTSGYSGDGGPATSAQLDMPYGVDVDSFGNIYVADMNNHRIRKIDAITGIINTIAGNGISEYSGDGGPAIFAAMVLPYRIAVDSKDNIYVSDKSKRIRKIDSDGIISTVIDNGTYCEGVAVDSAGHLYISDINHLVKKIQFGRTISGNAGVAGAILRYTDGVDKTVTADDTGAYSFTVPYDWSGAVTISKNGFTFLPESKSYSNVIADQTAQNYTANGVKYEVLIDTTIMGGSIEATPSTAVAGEVVNLTITPDSGKRLKAGTLKYNDGTDHDISGTSFTMPAGNVTVKAIFEQYAPILVDSVTVNPATVTVQKGTTYQFGAMVNGTNNPSQTVTWSVYGNNDGGTSINSSGLLTVAAEETATIFTAIATSVADSTKTGTATVTVSDSTPPNPTVTSVTVIPNTITLNKGDSYVLNAIVDGNNSPSQSVTWTVEGGNGTTAIGTDGKLTIADNETATTLTVRATSVADTSKYDTATVTVTQLQPSYTYTVTFMNGSSVYATKTVVSPATTIDTLPVNPTNGRYMFSGWYTGTGGSKTSFNVSTLVTSNITVYAYWTGGGNSGGNGGSSSSSGSTPSTPKYEANVICGNSSGKVEIKVDENQASIDLTSAQITSDKDITINMPKIFRVNSYNLGIPVSSLSTKRGKGSVTLNTDNGNITLPSDMLTGTDATLGSKAQVHIGAVNTSDLPRDAQTSVGNRPIIFLSLSIDGKTTVWNNSDAPVTISIPYTPTAEELKNLDSITAWDIDKDNNMIEMKDAKYDPMTKSIVFTTTHFNYYAVGYKTSAASVSFSDVLPGAWYYDAVSFIAKKDITTGIGDSKFSPEATLTRGQFIVMLMRAYGIEPDANPMDNFSDAANTYYTGYLAAAKRFGITNGVGDNKFAPEQAITRQEMFTLLYNALKAIGKLPQGDSDKLLSSFSDAGQIDSWAKDAMKRMVETGTIGGNNGMLTPTRTTTRGEMAQVLYNLLAK